MSKYVYKYSAFGAMRDRMAKRRKVVRLWADMEQIWQ